MRCLAAKHAELKEGAMREDAALAASRRRICMRYGFWRRCSVLGVIGGRGGERRAAYRCDDTGVTPDSTISGD